MIKPQGDHQTKTDGELEIMSADNKDIQVLENLDEFAVCPQCGYDGGFHTIFHGLNSDEPAKWILMCPSCKAQYDIGLRHLQSD
jgi:DNA-directed RNA polymerase subunit M/transcription elongation factor TFIIS